MPKRNTIDLNALRRCFPRLPFVDPGAAAARVVKLRSQSNDGSWTAESRKAARACFECKAAGIELALCIPEVAARDELMADERYQVKVDHRVNLSAAS